LYVQVAASLVELYLHQENWPAAEQYCMELLSVGIDFLAFSETIQAQLAVLHDLSAAYRHLALCQLMQGHLEDALATLEMGYVRDTCKNRSQCGIT
jgi:hypothetical protein